MPSVEVDIPLKFEMEKDNNVGGGRVNFIANASRSPRDLTQRVALLGAGSIHSRPVNSDAVYRIIDGITELDRRLGGAIQVVEHN